MSTLKEMTFKELVIDAQRDVHDGLLTDGSKGMYNALFQHLQHAMKWGELQQEKVKTKFTIKEAKKMLDDDANCKLTHTSFEDGEWISKIGNFIITDSGCVSWGFWYSYCKRSFQTGWSIV